MKLTALSFFLFFYIGAFAQVFSDTSPITISHIPDSQLITRQCTIFIDSTGTKSVAGIPGQAWQPLNQAEPKQFIPTDWITRKVFLKFTLRNNADSARTVYFIAGHIIRKNNFYALHPDGSTSEVPDKSKADGFQPLVVPAGKTQTFIAAFDFTKRQHNFLAPQLVNAGYLSKYQKFQYYRYDGQLPVGFLLSGILLMMIFFTAANYIIGKKKEFLYNCCYSICMFGLIFLTTLLERKSGLFASLFREYIDFLLLAVGTVFYIAFTRKFLETKTRHPLLNKIFVYEEKFVLLILVAFTYIVFFTDNFPLQLFLENGMKLIVLAIGILYIAIAIGQKNKLMNYLAVGNAILIVFSIISFLRIQFPVRDKSIFSSSMLYYEVGIVSELISFLLGLTYKNRVELIEKTKEQEALKLETEKQLFETKLAVIKAQQEERNRISADMHDDLGAGVTAIRLYSELAKKRIEKGSIPEIDKISASANELLNNMNAIIWTMSSNNDTLDNMVAYIRSYSLEYFENTGVNCHTYVDEDLPNIYVSGDIRRNVYLVVKEALNNILKHAKATEVNISLKRVPDGLSLFIQDNGTGIDFGNLRRFGNGLNNMKKRMEQRSISFNIENNNGTLITLHYDITF